jgi:hypothetical protein
VTSEFTKTVASLIAGRLWAELGGLAGLWLRLAAWLAAENARALVALDHSLVLLLVLPLYVLGVLAVGRALGLLSLRARRPVGGTR